MHEGPIRMNRIGPSRLSGPPAVEAGEEAALEGSLHRAVQMAAAVSPLPRVPTGEAGLAEAAAPVLTLCAVRCAEVAAVPRVGADAASDPGVREAVGLGTVDRAQPEVDRAGVGAVFVSVHGGVLSRSDEYRIIRMSCVMYMHYDM